MDLKTINNLNTKAIKNLIDTMGKKNGLKISNSIYKEKLAVINFKDGYLSWALEVSVEWQVATVHTLYRNNETRKILQDKSEQDIKIYTITEEDYLKKISEIIKEKIEKYETAYDYMFSIVIPVYNRESLIGDCIKSLNAQTIDKRLFEIIFVDDASVDDSIAVIENTIDKDLNYRIVKREANSGSASIPRNDGIRVAKGKYIFFLDSDDKIFEYTLQDSYDFLTKTNADILYVKVVSTSGRAVPIRTFKFGDIENADPVKNHLCRTLSCQKFYRNALLRVNDILFPNYHTNEDRLFTYEALTKARKISILANKPYYDLVKHGESQLSREGLPYYDYLEVLNLLILKSINSSANYEERHRLFNNMLSMIVDRIFAFAKLKDYKDVLPYLKSFREQIEIFDLIIDLKLAYAEQQEFLVHFKNKDYFNAYRCAKG